MKISRLLRYCITVAALCVYSFPANALPKCVEGVWHNCKASWTYDDGGRYVGDYVNGSRSGKGTYTWVNGNVYEGDWVGGSREGTGTMTWASGTVYEGDWVGGSREGTGTMTWGSGEWEGDQFTGEFIGNERTENGSYTEAKDVMEEDVTEDKENTLSLSDLYNSQKAEVQNQKQKKSNEEAKEMEVRLQKSIKNFLKTFNGEPRSIFDGTNDALDDLIKTGSTYPVGYILDGPHILRLEGNTVGHYSGPKIPELVLSAVIAEDGVTEFFSQNSLKFERSIAPHPSSVAKNVLRSEIYLYTKRLDSDKVSRETLYLGNVDAKFITKYFNVLADLGRNEKSPPNVVKIVRDFSVKYADFCRDYFNQTQWPWHGNKACGVYW